MSSKSLNRKMVLKLVAMTLGMFGFGYLLVPMYNVFCDITGIGGKTSDKAAEVVETKPDIERTIRLEFVTSVNANGPWEFHPDTSSMTVHPGQLYKTTFWARNRREEEVVGRAVPSVAPGEAAKYLSKTECFCFTEQAFGPGEGRHMPVVFIIDPDLPDYVDTMTLSYTFFDQHKVARTEGARGDGGA